ncbi:MAG: beta strand repeat-containing protein, partial [Gemmataceae bacterium]
GGGVGGGGAACFLGLGGGGGGFGGGGGSNFLVGGGGGGMGGGIFSMFGSLTVINSTLSGNTAKGGNGGGSATGGSGYGGAIFNLDGSATLTYSTVANNSAIAGTGASYGNADGSGVYNLAYGNTITTGGANTSALTLINSVIGQDSGGHDLVNDSENGKNTNTAQINGNSSVVQGGAQQLGNGTNSVAAGAISVTSAPNLATALANNGGLTQTLAPNSGSPVLGAGNPSLNGLPRVDQRGLSRPGFTAPIGADDGALQTQSTTTTITNVETAYTSAGLTVALTANVDLLWQQPVTEGQVQFSVDGVSQTATISSSNPGMANATITLPNTVGLGGYTIEAAYTDPNSIYSPSIGTGTFTLRTANSSLSVTDANSPIAYNGGGESLALQANVTSSNGGAVNAGAIVFTVNGVSSAPVPVSNGVASSTLLLSGTSLLIAGSYPNGISAAYTDAATNDFAAANTTGAVTVSAETTTITTPSISTTYNSTTAQTLTLSASVAGSNDGTVNEGSVSFLVSGTNLTATGLVHNGTATAMLTLPAGFAAGAYSLTASYADSPNDNGVVNFNAIASLNAATLTVNAATVTTKPVDIAHPIELQNGDAATLAANVTSANGGTVNEGTVTFTIINPNGPNLTATGSVSAGTASATLNLPNNFAAGTYVYIAGYSDSNNGNGVPNYVADNGAGTVDPPSGNDDTATLTLVNAPTSNPSVGNPLPAIGSAPPPTAPGGGLSPFAIGWGPTGIDLFEVDSQGDIFTQSLFGGGLQLVNTSLQLPLVLMGNEGLMAVLAAENGQDYFLDVFNPLLPSIESAVLAGVHS